MKKGTKKRLRRIALYALVAAALSFVALAILYLFLISGPDMSEELEAESKKIQKRMIPFAETALGKTRLQQPSEELLEPESLKVGDVEKELKALDLPPPKERLIYFTGAGRFVIPSFARHYQNVVAGEVGETRYETYLKTFDPSKESHLLSELLLGIAEKRHRGNPSAQRIIRKESENSSSTLHSDLDRAEDLFLSLNGPFVPDSDGVTRGCATLALAELAAIRASRRGDPETAARIILGYLRLLQAKCLSGRDIFNRDASPSQILVLPLKLEGFRDEHFAQWDAALAGGIIPCEQIKLHILAFRLKRGRELIQEIESLEVKAPYFAERETLKRNWATLTKGPAHMGWELFQPLAKKQMEEIMLAWASGEPSRIAWANHKRWALTRAYLPLAEFPATPKIEILKNTDRYFIPWSRWNRERVNAEQHEARITLACVRYRLARGRFPERIEDLTPTYLDSFYSENGWRVLRVEPNTYPIIPFLSHDSFTKAVDKYWDENEALPHTTEDLAPYFKDPSEAQDFPGRFEKLDLFPLISHFSFHLHDPDPNPKNDEEKQARFERFRDWHSIIRKKDDIYNVLGYNGLRNPPCDLQTSKPQRKRIEEQLARDGKELIAYYMAVSTQVVDIEGCVRLLDGGTGQEKVR